MAQSNDVKPHTGESTPEMEGLLTPRDFELGTHRRWHLEYTPLSTVHTAIGVGGISAVGGQKFSFARKKLEFCSSRVNELIWLDKIMFELWSTSRPNRLYRSRKL